MWGVSWGEAKKDGESVTWPSYDPDSTKHEFDTDVSIQDIKLFFRQHTGVFFSMFETGLHGNRFDLIRIDPRKRYIRIFEFKSNRRDFTSDKKWKQYLDYCHTLTFVCPREIIQKDDLPAGIGLMWIYKWRHKPSLIKSGAWMLESEWIKRPRRREVDVSIITDLALMLVYRTIWRKDDVF